MKKKKEESELVTNRNERQQSKTAMNEYDERHATTPPNS